MKFIYKNRIEAFIVVLFLIISFMGNVNIKAKTTEGNGKIILIDPGHGGFDGGAESVTGIKEKEFNLKISLFLKEYLQKSGYKVIMTREKDEALRLNNNRFKTSKGEDMAARCKLKMDSGCDMFISIHMNKFPEKQYYGAQVWYSKNPESKKLAFMLQANFKTYVDSSNRRVEKPANDSYKVLRCNDTIPAVIVECGFLSNPNEEANLRKEDYQRKVADTIAKSVNQYFSANKH